MSRKFALVSHTFPSSWSGQAVILGRILCHLGPFPHHLISRQDLEAFEPQSFDCVAALGLIEHLSDPEVLVRLVERVLKPGGMLFIQTPNTGSILAKVMRRIWFCYAPVEHIHYFSHRNLGAYLRRHGPEAVWSRAHWKHLEVGFVFHQMQFFGSELYKLARWLEKVLPEPVLRVRLPFYGGEMMLAARRPDAD